MTIVEHHSAEELQELFRQEKVARIAKRIWIAWQARLGRTEPQITEVIGWSRRSVQTWVQRYNEEGLTGLRDRTGRGRQPILSEAEQQLVADRLKEGDDLLAGMLGLNPRELFRDIFWNAVIASGSDLRCFGRGTNHS